MTKKEFILTTLLPFKEDPNKCGYEYGHCMYLTKEGKKCAVGIHLKEGVWQNFHGGVLSLDDKYNLKDILTKDALDQNLTLDEWHAIQKYHDGIADYILDENSPKSEIEYVMNIRVQYLEANTGLTFDELKF